MYAQMCTHPGIVFIIGMMRRNLSNPRLDHWRAVEIVSRYLQRTKNYMLTYMKIDLLEIIQYSDSNYIGCHDNDKSTLGYNFC